MKQFISECEPDNAGMLELSGKAYTYLIKVRRMREGDVLPVLLPVSGAADMAVDWIHNAKKQLRLKRVPCVAGCGGKQSKDTAGIQREYSAAEENRSNRFAPVAEIILLQWVLKGSKIDMVIRQATEAGVRAVLPVIGEFSVAKKQNPAQIERYRRIIKEARQQSGSLADTVVMEPAPLTAVLKVLQQLVPAEKTVFCMCSEAADNVVSVHRLFSSTPSHIVLAVGAEGGISPAEAALLCDAGFRTIHFKTNVLRAETAALYAIAAAQTIINEADQWQLLE